MPSKEQPFTGEVVGGGDLPTALPPESVMATAARPQLPSVVSSVVPAAGASDGPTTVAHMPRSTPTPSQPGSGPTVAPAHGLAGSGSGGLARTWPTIIGIEDVVDWLGDLNHDGEPGVPHSGPRLLNCGPATVAVFHRLSSITGNQRVHPGVLSIGDLEDATGLSMRQVDREGIGDRMRGSGPGAHTIAAVTFHDGSHHAFNVYSDGHRVWALDGQRGIVDEWPPRHLFDDPDSILQWYLGALDDGRADTGTANANRGADDGRLRSGDALAPGVSAERTSRPTHRSAVLHGVPEGAPQLPDHPQSAPGPVARRHQAPADRPAAAAIASGRVDDDPDTASADRWVSEWFDLPPVDGDVYSPPVNRSPWRANRSPDGAVPHPVVSWLDLDAAAAPHRDHSDHVLASDVPNPVTGQAQISKWFDGESTDYEPGASWLDLEGEDDDPGVSWLDVEGEDDHAGDAVTRTLIRSDVEGAPRTDLAPPTVKVNSDAQQSDSIPPAVDGGRPVEMDRSPARPASPPTGDTVASAADAPPALPARIGDDLNLGGMDVVDVFRSGARGNEGLSHVERIVRHEAGDSAWETNRHAITSLFSDDGLRAKVAGMLRGGRSITYAVDLGPLRALIIDLRLDGASERSALRYSRTLDDCEFEHTSDSTVDVGSHSEWRTTYLGGVQGNLTHPNVSHVAVALAARERQRAINRQRADRQISGAQTTEPATRFEGLVDAVITHRLTSSTQPVDTRVVPYQLEVIVPTRDVVDQAPIERNEEPRNTPGPQPSLGSGRHFDRLGGPPRVVATRALSGSDVVSNLWLLPDDDHQPRGDVPLGPGTPTPQRVPLHRSVGDFVTSAPMWAGFGKTYGRRAALVASEVNDWLTVELLQANLHGMTHKQPLVRRLVAAPGAWVEVHAFLEPIGTPAGGVAAPAGPRSAVSGQRPMMRATGHTTSTEFHYGIETDTVRVEQDSTTWTAQFPGPGRFRVDGVDAASASGGLDGYGAVGYTDNEARIRQFRTRVTLKNSVPAEAWHGQVRLRFVMHAPGSGPTFEGAVHETRARFDALIERSEGAARRSFRAVEVWAPPDRIWGHPPEGSNSVARSPWWRPGIGLRRVVGAGGPSSNSARESVAVPAPRSEDLIELIGIGSMDRVTDLDISGLLGMLDAMGGRAFGSSWKRVRPVVSAAFHLDRVRAALPAMTQHSPMTQTMLSGPGSATKVEMTADVESLVFRRVIDTLASPSHEVTRGHAHTTTTNKQVTAHLALGGHGGEVAGGPVFGEVLGGVGDTRRDGYRLRRRERTVVATKFDQPMAVFGGWVRLDATMTGSAATVHESGLFPVELAIPLTELPGPRTHDEDRPPEFTRDHRDGLADPPSATRPEGSVEPPRSAMPRAGAAPPAHALQPSWHPSDMLIGVDPASGLAEAIRRDLATVLGDDTGAVAGIMAEFGPQVLPARLTHESGERWIHDVPSRGGVIRVEVRPVREGPPEYLGSSKRFESDVSSESQSAIGHLRGNVRRAITGVRLQVPIPHGSVSVQVTRGKTFRSRTTAVIGDGDVGLLVDANYESTTAEAEERIPVRVKTTEPHDLYRQPIRFDIAYQRGLGSRLLSDIPERPQPVRLMGVFAYPQVEPATAEPAPASRLDPGHVVVKVRPRFDDAAVDGATSVSRFTAGEDLMAAHVLDAMSPQGKRVFGDRWPAVRAELAPYVDAMAIQRELGHLSRGKQMQIDVSSASGGRVVLGARVHTVSRTDSATASEFYSGGQNVHTAGTSNTEANQWQGYLQVQGDALPGQDVLNLSVIGRMTGTVGRETITSNSEIVAGGLLLRRKVAAAHQVGLASIDAIMSRPEGFAGVGSRRLEVPAHAEIVFHARALPADGVGWTAPPEPTAVELGHHGIVRRLSGGADFRATVTSELGARVSPATMRRIGEDFVGALDDTRLEGRLPAMLRDGVELFGHGALRLVGRAEAIELRLAAIEATGSSANVLNEVNQTLTTLNASSREGAVRLLAGPHWRLPGFQGSLRVGGGVGARHRGGPTFSQTAKVAANAKYASPYVAFEATFRVTLALYDAGRRLELLPVDVHGEIMIPYDGARLSGSAGAARGAADGAAGSVRDPGLPVAGVPAAGSGHPQLLEVRAGQVG